MAAESGTPRRSWRRHSGFILLAALLLLWQWSALYVVSSTNWPPVTEIARGLVSSLRSGELTEAFLSSMVRMLIGYGLGVVLAVALGLVMANHRLVRAALEPLVEFLRPIPVPAIVPPLILLLGIDDAMKIFVVTFSVFFPVLVNTIAGVRSVDPVALDVARTLQVSRTHAVLFVVFPASLPYILAGMRVSLALALIVTYGSLSGFRTSWAFILVGHVLFTLPFMVRSVLAEPEVRDGFLRQSFHPAPMSPQETAAFLHAEYAKWAKVVRDADIKIN